jgi:hypothetical protein
LIYKGASTSAHDGHSSFLSKLKKMKSFQEYYPSANLNNQGQGPIWTRPSNQQQQNIGLNTIKPPYPYDFYPNTLPPNIPNPNGLFPLEFPNNNFPNSFDPNNVDYPFLQIEYPLNKPNLPIHRPSTQLPIHTNSCNSHDYYETRNVYWFLIFIFIFYY